MHIIPLFIGNTLNNPSFDLKNVFLMKILFINQRYGVWLQIKQQNSDVPPNRWDLSFLEFIRKATESETDQEAKSGYLHALRLSEATHDLSTASIKEINPLIQFGPGPNLELKEAKVELYKISVSFSLGGKIDSKLSVTYLCCDYLFEGTPVQITAMKGSKHRVLFQNADENINMGVIFNDPDLELYDICWYIALANQIEYSLARNEGLITVDRKLNTMSCYVELHRNGENRDLAVWDSDSESRKSM